MSDIRAGDVVVCVDASWDYDHTPDQVAEIRRYLRVGRHYRVDQVGTFKGVPTLYLSGIPEGPWREGWLPSRFRKIKAPKTKLSERIRKCRPIPVREDA